MLKGSVDLSVIVTAFESRMRLARASEHAVAGRLFEAEALLAPPGKLPNTWDEIDLLARIYVYQSKFAQALRLWKKSLVIPGHEEIVAARVESLNAYANRQFEIRRNVVIAIVVAWVVLFVVTLVLLVVRLLG